MSDTARILIVDDDEAMRRMIDRMLAREGHECAAAASSVEACALLADRDFDLAICDVMMPDVSGLELIEELRARDGDLSILMASGQDDPAVAGIAAERGAVGYLVKPFELNELLIAVSNALHRRRLEIENRDYRGRLEEAVEERTAELRSAIASLTDSRRETIHRLARAVEMRDVETGGHIERIGEQAALIAAELGLPQDEVDLIRIASPMHDVGKIGIPDRILLKPGKLTPEERAEMQRHAEIGRDLLSGSSSELLDVAATIAATHHERYDGKGYPTGLAGEEIPIEGRIVAVVDVFDALTHDRVYRPAMSVDEALEIIREGRGTQFDPAVVDSLLANLGSILGGAAAGGGSR